MKKNTKMTKAQVRSKLNKILEEGYARIAAELNGVLKEADMWYLDPVLRMEYDYDAAQNKDDRNGDQLIWDGTLSKDELCWLVTGKQLSAAQEKNR